MSWVVNPHAIVTSRVDGRGVEWTVDATVRGEGRRHTVVSATQNPAAHAYLLRIARGGSSSTNADEAHELARAGLLVRNDAVSRAVTFAATLSSLAPPRVPRLLAVNRRVRLGDAPRGAPLGRGRVAYVTDPVRGVELPYWIDAGQEAAIERALATGKAPSRNRGKLAAAGVLYDADETRAARRRLARMLAASRRHVAARGYMALGELLPAAFVASLARYFRALIEEGHLPLGDLQTRGRYNMHNEPLCRWLHERITSLVERAVAREIKRSYCYAAAYVGGAVLERHTDRPQCEYTLSLAVDATPKPSRETAWPLCLESERDQAVVCVQLAPGDALLFRGRTLPHFRERLDDGHTATSLLFHFVHRNFRGALS